MVVELSMKGEGMSFEQEISKSVARDIISTAMDDHARVQGTAETTTSSSGSVDGSALPSNFFDRLSNGQEVFIRILLNDGGWITSEEIRQRMEAEYDYSASSPQAISGIRSGFTRKYGEGFDIVKREWMGRQNKYRLNERYSEELDERLNQLGAQIDQIREVCAAAIRSAMEERLVLDRTALHGANSEHPNFPDHDYVPSWSHYSSAVDS